MAQTILLIDDSAILRRIATNVLGGRAIHYEVMTATRATEGFALACGTQPALILVDARLAGTVKAELCQRFLDEPRTAAVPMVLLLGQGVQPPKWDDLPKNIVDTLSKPFTPEQLTSSVKAILGATKEDRDFASIRRLRGDRVPGETMLVDRQGVTDAPMPEADRSSRQHWTTGAAPPLIARGLPHDKPSSADHQPSGHVLTGSGSLRATMKSIAAEKLSGVLSLRLLDRPPMDVYFEAGHLVVVTTKDAGVYSRDAAGVLPAKVSPATLEAAVDEQRLSSVPFFLTLGARGLLSKAAAVDLVHRFGQRLFAQTWELRSSHLHCEFTHLDALPGFALRLETRRESIDEWLLSTLRCLQPDDVVATAKHEGFVGTPVFSRHGPSLLNFLNLTAEEKEMVRRVSGRLDLPSIAKGMGITAEAAFLLLYRFRALEIMEYRPAPAAFMVTPRTNVRRVLPLRR